MDSVDQIEELIVGGCHDFDLPSLREDLHVTIRIARDFYNFLVTFGEKPPTEEIDYVTGTIRSGIDEFFLLAYNCRSISTTETKRFYRHVHWDFPSLRRRFMLDFEHLAESPDATASHRLASLLTLTHLELAFLAQHFPSAIWGDAAYVSELSAEFLLDVVELRDGRLSLDEVIARALARRDKT